MVVSTSPKARMTEWTSLFAQKLKAHRLGQGRHGRMTQGELAETLGVSLDAISKYERSLSFIRGDLEARLIDTLGWSREDVVACREDWEAGRRRQTGGTYRLVSEDACIAMFDGSYAACNAAIAALEYGDLETMPDGYSASAEGWVETARSGAVNSVYVFREKSMVAFFGLVFFGPDLEQRFRDSVLEDAEIRAYLLKRPILPGSYFGYCPALYIARGHEAAARLLLTGVVALFEELADRDILVEQITAISMSSLGRQLCSDLGFDFLGPHRNHPEFGMWSLPSSRIGSSLLGRRSAKLRLVYGA